MPSTVAEILAAAGAQRAGVARWGELPDRWRRASTSTTGIYIVALTDLLDRVDGTLEKAPASLPPLKKLLERRPELTLDKMPEPTPRQLQKRLSEFWLPDETVLYIGLADARGKLHRNGHLGHRVHEYCATRIGAKSPHAGGWPVKTLGCLSELWVHYAYCDDVHQAEGKCLERLADHVSPETRATLRDPVRVMPFANLEYPPGNRKDHGIAGARGPLPKSGLTPAELALPY
jgi:hypothetical protein